jgi:hypothetical protein
VPNEFASSISNGAENLGYPERGTGAAVVLPRANAEGMNLHLKEVSLCVAPGAHAVVLLDGAGWHVANDLEIPENITTLLSLLSRRHDGG